MPNIYLTIPEVEQAVSRPSILKIVQQVQELTGFPENTKTMFAGDIRTQQTAGSGIADTSRHPRFDNDVYNYIEVEEDHDLMSINTTAVGRKEHIPVFFDEKLGVQISPIYSSVNVSINFVYKSPSKTDVLRWRDQIRMKISAMRDINLHKIEYHFGIPVQLLVILKHIYDKREAVEPYGDTFEQYVKSFSTERLTLLGDLVGKNARIAVTETQTRIVGLYDFEGMPQKPEREDTGNWSITFTYKFTYDRPLGMQMKYPVMVHNQLLDDPYLNYQLPFDKQEIVPKSFSYSLNAMHAFENDTVMNAVRQIDPLIRIPDCDDFVTTFNAVGYAPALSVLTSVEDDKKTLFNLNELGDYDIDVDILDFIRNSEFPYICRQFHSMLYLGFYRDKFLTNTESINCDLSLNVSSNQELDLRTQHRVRLFICTDLRMLKPGAIQRLREYPKALVKIIGCINELIRDHPDFNELYTMKRVSHVHFDKIYSIITGFHTQTVQGEKGHYYGPGIDRRELFKDLDPRVVENYRRNNYARNTVMNNQIVAKRLDHLKA